MKKINDALLIFAFVAIIFAVPLLTYLEPPKSTSDFENRKLATAPVYTTSTLVDGKYFSGWESYFSDHVVKRDLWLKSYIYYEMKTLRRTVVNSVIIQKDLLLPYFEPQDIPSDLPAKAADMGDKLSALQSKIERDGGKFLYLAVPEQYSLFRNSYNAGYYSGANILQARENEFLAALDARKIDYLSMRPLFVDAGKYKTHYMKTDHHYSLAGAQFTYNALLEKLGEMGFDLPAPTEITFETLENPFYGSRGRKLYNLAEVDDKLLVGHLNAPIAFTREDDGKPVAAEVFHLPTDDTVPVAYGLYMGGDKAETIIRTNRPELPNVLLFGDSFTNALETMLYTSFNETRSLDFRHYTDKTLSEYVAEYKPDIVICLRDDTSFLSPDGNGSIE